MCFSPKIKMPKTQTQQIRAPEPPPLTEEVKGVEFGSTTTEDKDEEGSTSSEVKSSSGKSSLKVELDKNKSKSTSGGAKRMSVKSRMGGKK